MLEDFNKIFSRIDKLGGHSPYIYHLNRAWLLIHNCSFLDMGFSGQPYTWTNSQTGSGRILERIDRAWCTKEWRILFPYAVVIHLPRSHSDHTLILLK